MNVIILDDYQDAVRKLRCASLMEPFNAKVFTNTVKGNGQLSVRLRDADVVVLIRERTHLTRALLEKHNMRAVCSLGLPEKNWASVNPDGAIEQLCDSIDKAAEMGAEALSGVTYGGIGQRTGLPPTMEEYDNIARALSTCATPGEILIRTLRNLEVSLQRHDENEDAALIHRLIESLKP